MRKAAFSDINDQSPNEPIKLISPSQLKLLYDNAHPYNKLERITDVVKQWFQKEAQSRGWMVLAFTGNQCILKVPG